MAWQRRNAPVVALGAVLLANAILLLYLGRNLTFIQDTWYFLLYREGTSPDAFLQPHNEHIVAIPVAIEKLLVALFGMSSALPERVVLTLMLLVTAVLVFVYVRRRIGAWPGVIAATLLLFLGPSWSVLIWPFEIVIVGSVMTGVAALLLLERDDRRGDVLACLLLALSVGFSGIGISFAAGAAVDVLLRRRERGLGRAWVPLVPLLLFAGWYLGWGHEAESHFALDNVLRSPIYLLEGVANSIASLLGLSTIDVNDVGEPDWGRPLLVAAIALVIWGQTKRRGFSPRLWPVAAAAASYWLLAGFNYMPGRDAVSGRYGYAGAVFVLLVAAELLRGVRFSRNALLLGGAVTAVAVASNLVAFHDGQRWMEDVSVLSRADTAAIEIAERTVPPSFTLTPEVAGTASILAVEAGRYLEAVREHGSPAYSVDELAAAPETGRRQADVVLGQALPLSTSTQPGSFRAEGAPGCLDAVPGEEIELGPGTARIEVSPGPHADFSLRRFAQESHPVQTAGAEGGAVTLLTIPPDKAPQPWFLLVEAEQPVRVCP
ncbi:MAG TPA: hypothetical protein VLI94_06610 [Solirubrobacterales bacterium]|nr:hypothetical protein [Solirubrobacterales bacterium]